MGVERAVTHWYVQRQVILAEIASLEARLAQMRGKEQEPDGKQRVAIEEELANEQAKLHNLGPCPKPMMG